MKNIELRQKSNSLTKQQKQEINARRKSSSTPMTTSKQLKASEQQRCRIRRRHTVGGTKDIGKENLIVTIKECKNFQTNLSRRLSLPEPTWLHLFTDSRNNTFRAFPIPPQKKQPLNKVINYYVLQSLNQRTRRSLTNYFMPCQFNYFPTFMSSITTISKIQWNRLSKFFSPGPMT